MTNILSIIFAPNPGRAAYGDPWVMAILIAAAVLILGSFLIRFWRARLSSAVTKRLSKSWSSATFWFGISALILILARVERIQFLAMPFLWVLWGLFAVLFVLLQIKLFTARHYEVLPTVRNADPRDAYLPKPKRK